MVTLREVVPDDDDLIVQLDRIAANLERVLAVGVLVAVGIWVLVCLMIVRLVTG